MKTPVGPLSWKMAVTVAGLWLVLTALTCPSYGQTNEDYLGDGAIWKLKPGFPQPDKHMQYAISQWGISGGMQVSPGTLISKTSDGVECAFSFTPPPGQLAVGQPCRATLRGVSTSRPGAPNKIEFARIYVGQECTSKYAGTKNGERKHIRVDAYHSVVVYPPPFRADMAYPNNDPDGPHTGAHDDELSFMFQPTSDQAKNREFIFAVGVGPCSYLYSYEPFTPAAAARDSVTVKNATKTCTPEDAYPRITAQPAAGPNFGPIPEQLPTLINCTLEAEVTRRFYRQSHKSGPMNLTIIDSLSPGLFYDKVVPPTIPPGIIEKTYTNNLVTFFVIRLEMPQVPQQTVLQRNPIKLDYTAFLNDLAEQRFPQRNTITLRVSDAVTGNLLLEHPPISVDITPLIPRMSLSAYADSTTGLPGDRKTFTIVVYNTGTIPLQSVDIDALVPDAMTVGAASLTPPGLPGNPVRWRGLGPISPKDCLAVSYVATINPNTPEGTELVGQAFAHAITPNYAGAGTRRLNSSAGSGKVVVTVSPIRTGIEITLTPRPNEGHSLKVITYDIKVRNSGEVTLDRLRLDLTQGTLPWPKSPTFLLDPLGPGKIWINSYKGQIGLLQKGVLVDVARIEGRPVNRGVQVSDVVKAMARALVRVLPPAIVKITPATAPQGSNNVGVKIEGVGFVPGTVVAFLSGDGVEIIPPHPSDYGFVGSTELLRSMNIQADARPGEREVVVVNPNGVAGGNRPFNVFTVTSRGKEIVPPATNAPSLPPEIAVALTRAQELSAAGRHAEAVPLLDRVLAQAPGNPLALWHRGIARLWTGDLKGSVADLDALLALDPANLEIRRVRSLAALADGIEVAAVRATMMELLRVQPNNAQLLLVAGQAELASGNSAAAQQYFGRATAADPQLINGVYQQACQFLQAGVPKMAYVQFLAVVWSSPNFADGQYGAGMAAAQLGYKAQAIQLLEQHLRLAPSSSFAAAARQELARLRDAP